MASYLFILMAFLCFEQGSALQCYTCVGDSCHGKGQRSANCSSSDAYCETIVITAQFDTYKFENVIQKCSSTCEQSNTTLGVVHVTSQCCNYTLCNSNGVAHVTASGGAIVLTVLTCFIFPLFGSRL
ncbi:prostate stem cell antigen-like [Petaurus breviceps papuanus]|uniref:prostate stem cell antigen-like n=1 Tax=Petaurus breviceps papuanus TaxID=3040969 RepID=UPI0036D8662E